MKGLLEAFKRPPLAVVESSATARPNRERLKAAIAGRDAAQKAVSSARAALERLQAVIDQADDAARAAATAAEQAKQARHRWVRNGCLSNAREHQALAEDAAQAASVAQSAAQDGDAVSKELARAADALRSRQFDVGQCDSEISAAIGAILAAEAEPVLERFEQLAEAYRATRVEIKALQRVLEPQRFEDSTAASSNGAQVITAALTRASIKSWDQERDGALAKDFIDGTRRDDAILAKLMARWGDRAAQLRADPES